MDPFIVPKTFQAKPSNLKKKVALVAFIAGAVLFTLTVTKVIVSENSALYFAGSLVTMAFAFRFWNMQVRAGAMAVTFDSIGITIANRSTSNHIAWEDLAAIRYKATRGGHYWEFKARGRDDTIDYYVDGLTSDEQDNLRATISSIQRLGVLIEPFYNPMGMLSVDD